MKTLGAMTILLASGCSVIGMRDAPAKPVSPPTCTDSRFPPFVDLLAGGAAGLMTYTFGGGDAEMRAHMGNLPYFTGAMAVLFTGSAVVGFVRASSCTQAKEEWSAQAQPAPMAPVAMVPMFEAVAAKTPVAARLTREAHDAAVAFDCGPTLANGPRVQSLDPEYYDRVFLVDDAIARCR